MIDSDKEELEKSKNDLDQLSDNKIKHVIEGSVGSNHKWEKLVPDKNWGAIREVIKDVLQGGIQSNYKGGPAMQKEIAGHVVEVAYRVVDGIKRISGAWVK